MIKILIAGLALAASGDLIYLDTEVKGITTAQAAGLADAFIAIGAWSGARADMVRCVVERTADTATYPTGFRAKCIGEKSAAPGSVPFPANVIGVEP